MAHNIVSALARVRHQLGGQDFHLGRILEQQCRDQRYQWRDRILTPMMTLQLFCLQILHANTAILHLRQLAGRDFAASSFCAARQRLPLLALQGLLGSFADWAVSAASGVRAVTRVFVVDGSNFSMPDETRLCRRFGLPSGSRPAVEGVAYPMAKIIGLLDLATGMFTRVLALPLYTQEFAQVHKLHGALRRGDILVGDRGFCSYVQLALLSGQGLLGCFRLHQRRTILSLGRQRWDKPLVCPKWMSHRAFARLPKTLLVRLVEHAIVQPGFRTHKVVIVTTLLDEQVWPDARIAELYAWRWHIETCFDHLKTTMNMNVLKCRSVDGVLKELAVYLLVYNLVWLAMLEAARRQGVDVWRVSFVDAMRYLAARACGLPGVARLVINPDRRGRCEPRVVRRRPKQYDRLMEPRWQLKRQMLTRDRA